MVPDELPTVTNSCLTTKLAILGAKHLGQNKAKVQSVSLCSA